MRNTLMATLVEWLSYPSRIAVGLIAVLQTIDIIGSKLFGFPIVGVKAYVELLLVVAVFCGIPYATAKAGDISVDFVAQRMGEKAVRIVNLIHYILGFLIVAFFAWRSLVFTQGALQSHAIMKGTEAGFPLPIWPAALTIPVAFTLLMVIHVVRLVTGEKG